MTSDSSSSFDVVIAGAGPVGLMLACELRLGGCSVLILERATDPASPLKALPFGLRGLSVATIEGLERRGLLDTLVDRAPTPGAGAAHWQGQPRRPAGHFAGIPFFHDQIDQAEWTYRLPSQVATLATDMASLEAVLAERAEALGAVIVRGRGVDAIDARGDGVVVRAGDKVVTAAWLVGCDGGRSAVRKAAGIGFAGTEAEFTGYSVAATLAAPHALQTGRTYTPTGMYLFNPPGTIAMVEFDGGACHRTVPLTREHVEAVLRRVSGTDVAVEALHQATTWTDRAFQASAYRQGRVLLAGDAAHIHSPLGGQGLNLGLGDAMNLGWKLAATIRGDAPADLLDSYAGERAPVGAQVLDWSRAQVALMRPDAGTRALAAVMRDLLATRDGATHCAERVWGVGLRYDLGSDHPLVGRSAPDLAFADGSRLNDHLRGGRGLFVEIGARCMRRFAERWSGRIDHLGGATAEPFGVCALLVRPDGIVGWASDAAPDEAGAEAAATRWFGRPDAAPGTPRDVDR